MPQWGRDPLHAGSLSDVSAPERVGSLQARLARLGASDAAAAVRLLTYPVLTGLTDPALDDLALAPDVDLALRTLARISETADAAGLGHLADLVEALDTDERVRARTYAVLGMSSALGDHLVRHPEDWTALRVAPGQFQHPRQLLLPAVGADPQDAQPQASGPAEDWLNALRVAYHHRLLTIAADDLTDEVGFDVTVSALSDLADATLEAALAIARAQLPADAAPCRLAIVAMGKCGGRELNYVSDVDVLFVAAAPTDENGEPLADEVDALTTATRLAQGVMRACSAATSEGSIWEVDANLRPEGRDGALVRTLASYDGYYKRWASTWEFQALLKARPAAGDLALGREFADLVSPMVWSAADRDGFVVHVQAMRRRVVEHVSAKDGDRQLKLGPGGLRDVEFSVQLLQLVHGRSDITLHSPTTLEALEALATWGYVARADASALASAYVFLRTLEHRLQLYLLRRTHVMPTDRDDLRRIARSMGFRTDPVVELNQEWQRHAVEVRRLHEKLFYRPLLEAVARLDAGDARLTIEAAEQRLLALGYRDPPGAMRHLEALTAGVTRRAAIQRTLLPVLLGWFAESPDPDAGLLAFRRVSDALGGTPWYLRLLRDDSLVAQRLAHVLASSRYASDLLLRAPEAVRMLADDVELRPRQRDALIAEAVAAADRHRSPEGSVAAVRALRRRELWRTAVSELVGTSQDDEAAGALSNIVDATITGALAAARRSVPI